MTSAAPGTEQRGSWHAFASSVTGAAHLAQDRPNEDACLARRTGAVSVAVVADGHGSPRCPRAGRGAALAVAAIADLLEGVLADGDDAPTVRRRLVDETAPALVERWRAEVSADAAEQPFSAEELQLIDADGAEPSDQALWLAYGCTLVAMGATADVLAVLQIGDGDCVTVSRAGAVTKPLPDDPTNRGNVTSSLSQAKALDALRCATIDLRRQPQLLAFAASDGFGGAYVEVDWWHQVGRDLASRAAELPPEELEGRLPDWLAEPARVGGDDATMALLVTDRAAGADPIPATEPVATTPDDPITAELPSSAEPAPRPTPGDDADPGPRWRRLAWAVAGLLLVAALAGAALAITSSSDDQPDPAPGPTSTTAPVIKEPPGSGSSSSSTTDPSGAGSHEADQGVDLLDEGAGG